MKTIDFVKKYSMVGIGVISLSLFTACGGDETTVIEGSSGETDYTAEFVLDMDNDGLAHYPFGPDMDDDNDGLLTRLAGGSDVDDQDPSVGKIGKGNGHFSSPHFYWGSEDDPETVGFGDFNSDGWTDHFVLESSIYAAGVYLNQGNQIFNTAIHYGVDSCYDDQSPTVGDFNEDNNLDMALVNSCDNGDTRVKIIWGDGNGYFTGSSMVTELGTGGVDQVITADFDKDGHLDLAITDTDNTRIIVAFNAGEGNFSSSNVYDVNASSVYNMQFGDLNNDGNFDLVVTRDANITGNDGVTTYINDGVGNFTVGSSIDLNISASGGNELALGDFNEDGNLDLATRSSSSSSLEIALGDGAGSFTSSHTIDLLTSDNNPDFVYNVSDINGDGHTDIITAEDDDEQISVLLGNGEGNFTIGIIDLGYDVEVVGASVADFNGDGIFDIAISSDEPSEPQAGLYVVYGQSDDLVVK